VRFWLEFLRGDEGRTPFAGLSETQWTSLAVTGALAVAVAAGWSVLPLWLPLGAAAALGAGVALVATRAERVRLLEAGHVRDLARVVGAPAPPEAGSSPPQPTRGASVGLAPPASRRSGVPRLLTPRLRWGLLMRPPSPVGCAAVGPAVGRSCDAAHRSGNGVYHL
jgi:hypothetical protein